MFQYPDSDLYHLWQGDRSISKYTRWHSRPPAVTLSYEGLAPRLKDELTGRKLPDTREGPIELSHRRGLWMNSHLRPVPHTLPLPSPGPRPAPPQSHHSIWPDLHRHHRPSKPEPGNPCKYSVPF